MLRDYCVLAALKEAFDKSGRAAPNSPHFCPIIGIHCHVVQLMKVDFGDTCTQSALESLFCIFGDKLTIEDIKNYYKMLHLQFVEEYEAREARIAHQKSVTRFVADDEWLPEHFSDGTARFGEPADV